MIDLLTDRMGELLTHDIRISPSATVVQRVIGRSLFT